MVASRSRRFGEKDTKRGRNAWEAFTLEARERSSRRRLICSAQSPSRLFSCDTAIFFRGDGDGHGPLGSRELDSVLRRVCRSGRFALAASESRSGIPLGILLALPEFIVFTRSLAARSGGRACASARRSTDSSGSHPRVAQAAGGPGSGMGRLSRRDAASPSRLGRNDPACRGAPRSYRTPIARRGLVGFVASRLLLAHALSYAAKELLEFDRPLAELRDELEAVAFAGAKGNRSARYPIFLLARILGWAPDELSIDLTRLAKLAREVEVFPEVERRHLPFGLRAVPCSRSRRAASRRASDRPRFQIMTCLDERESRSGGIEEIAPDCDTFGVAGFYGVAMYYRGAAEAHFVPLCPVVIRPKHWVEEAVDETVTETHQRTRRVRRALGRVSHQMHVGTRTFAFGALLSAGLGALASIPLVARVLFPGLTARLRRRAGQFVQPPKKTRCAGTH